MSPTVPPPGNPQHPDQPPDDAAGGGSTRVEDKRAEFERISRQQPHDPEAERAFIESKIEIIRTDPNLSDDEKERAIQELRERL